MIITKRTTKTIIQGGVGGVLGSLVGVPALGVTLGVANANKDKIKKVMKDVK